jgi:hypothetical protein
LPVRIRPNGYDVLARAPAFRRHAITVRVTDPHAITPDKLYVHSTGDYDLFLSVALALVPVFGAITVAGPDGETYVVDGSQNQHQLRHERAARVTAKLRDLVARRGG